jgi:putative ABC transport system permease protein
VSARPGFVLRACLALLRAASRLVPRHQREGWLHEWRAEVLHRWQKLEERRELGARAQAELARRVMGALPDAVWLRRQLTLDADLVHDLRHGLRVLRREGGSTVAAACVLGLGLGASTAVFGVVDALLLRPLPYREPDRIVTLWQTHPQRPGERGEVAPANFLDWRERLRAFEHVAAANPWAYDYTGGAEPEVVFAIRVTEGFLEALGTTPVHGRGFLPEEYRAGRERVALVAHGLWQRRFGGDPGVVGRAIPLDGQPYTVVGVLPADFEPGLLPTAGERGLYTPHVVEEHDRVVRGSAWWNVVARLAPGVSATAARHDLDRVARELAAEHPRTNAASGIALVPLAEHLTAGVRPALRLLVGAVALLLLLTWANVAGLLLARGKAREGELRVRASLGASRSRLGRQLVAENALVALAGGALGLALARWGMQAIVTLSPVDVPRLGQVGLSGRVLAFALAAALVSALACGLLPALRFSRPGAGTTLLAAERTSTRALRREPLRQGLVVGELAIALVLLAGAGLLVRSFERLSATDPGFRKDGVLALQVFARDRQTTPEARTRFFEDTLGSLAGLPGVEAAGAVSRMPFIEANIGIRSSLQVEGGRELPPDEAPRVFLSTATPGYFEAMGIALLSGRPFDERDHAGRPTVALINQALAREHFGDGSPLGRRLRLRFGGRELRAEVVGVVASAKHERLEDAPEPEAFLPHAQTGFGSMTYVLCTRVDPASLTAAAKRRIREHDPLLAFYRTASLRELVAKSLAERRFLLVLISGFAGIAALLASVGLYGLLSFLAGERRREIGVRMALGAEARDIVRLVLRQGLRLVAPGLGLGLLAALFATRALAGALYGVSHADPLTLAGVAALTALVPLAACYLPARRALRVDPCVTLRSE